MIRKGQRAKVTYCKKANYLHPVSAKTKSPGSGTIHDGMEKARPVVLAGVVAPAWRDSKQNQSVELLSARDVEVKSITKGKAEVCTVVAAKLQSKPIGNAKEDITIENLFSKD